MLSQILYSAPPLLRNKSRTGRYRTRSPMSMVEADRSFSILPWKLKNLRLGLALLKLETRSYPYTIHCRLASRSPKVHWYWHIRYLFGKEVSRLVPGFSCIMHY